MRTDVVHRRVTRPFLAAAMLLLAAGLPRTGFGQPAPPESGVEMRLSRETTVFGAVTAIESRVVFPGDETFFVHSLTTEWARVGSLDFDVVLPADAPTNAQVMLHVKDWDHLWFQNLLPGFLRPGARTRFHADLAASAAGWEPRGHHAEWNLRAHVEPKEVGIHVFSSSAYEGTCRIERVAAALSADSTPPFIRNVLANRRPVPLYEKLELTFDLPDRYVNPFDPDQVRVTGEFEDPEGGKVTVDGYYGCRYYRETSPLGERIVPQGRPYWRVRFAPLKRGVYRYTLRVRDAFGEAQWGPETFEATAPESPGCVRVSAKDPRHFEFSDGSYYFPIGHNIRSPFDTRHDAAYPWARRVPEGSTAYQRYFRNMAEHGETLAEVWNSAWSLGLEWSPLQPGYHGVGRYNMIHAWEMDRVVDEAEARGILINYVINNHGKFSTFSDQEWNDNPFNTANGGYLATPEEFFSDPRAFKDFLNLMRYMIARWGYSHHLFAWELWSELDLTGSRQDGGTPNYRRPEVVAWHRAAGRAIKEMDPNHHLVSTHVCGDYSHQNLDIITLPEIDHCPVDAYHGNPDALHIVELLKQTAAFNNPYGKPVLVTEFGGSSGGGTVLHMDHTLHAALWTSTAIPLAGTPLFWWWHLIEEENFYPKYAAVARFMQGEDRRDPELTVRPIEVLRDGEPAPEISTVASSSRRRVYGWLYSPHDFAEAGAPVAPQSNLVLRVEGMMNGIFVVEAWDTAAGQVITRQTLAATNHVLLAPLPPFTRDVAVKVKID